MKWLKQKQRSEGQAKVRTRKVEINLPEGFHELIAAVAKLKGISVEEYIIDELIDALDCTLQNPMGWAADMSFDYAHDYCEQVRALAYPENAEAI